MKHVNTRFPDDLYDEMAEAANAEERPIGSWLRLAAKEKLARRESGKVRYESSGGVRGLELQGHSLYAVRNSNQVSVVRLDSQLTSGVVLGDITGELDTPSTGTVAAGRLWVVNPRFNTPPSPSTEYWIAQLPLRPENG